MRAIHGAPVPWTWEDAERLREVSKIEKALRNGGLSLHTDRSFYAVKNLKPAATHMAAMYQPKVTVRPVDVFFPATVAKPTPVR